MTAIRWALSSRPAFGGMRPAAVGWFRMPAPGWFAEEGWALTPETAGMAGLMGRGPHLGPIVARVRRDPAEVRVLIGGRNLAAAGDPAARFTLSIDGRTVDSWDAAPGFFLRTTMLPAGALTGDGPLAELTVRSAAVTGDGVIPTAIEQFDLQLPETLMWGFDAGWHEAEYTPAMGVWRWTSERSSLRVHGATTDVRVTIGFESPLRYFEAPITLRARAGDAEIASSTVEARTRGRSTCRSIACARPTA